MDLNPEEQNFKLHQLLYGVSFLTAQQFLAGFTRRDKLMTGIGHVAFVNASVRWEQLDPTKHRIVDTKGLEVGNTSLL